MSTEYPPFITPVLGLTILIAPCLWYFEWAAWAWIVAGFIYVAICCSWLSDALAIYWAKPAGPQPSPENNSHHLLDEYDEDEFLAHRKTLWEGRRQIHFAYAYYRGCSSSRKVTVHKVFSIGRTNEDTYFWGHCHMRNELRTFRLDRIKGRKVVDSATGKVATFRQLFSLRGR